MKIPEVNLKVEMTLDMSLIVRGILMLFSTPLEYTFWNVPNTDFMQNNTKAFYDVARANAAQMKQGTIQREFTRNLPSSTEFV